jgi:hypothetical protein
MLKKCFNIKTNKDRLMKIITILLISLGISNTWGIEQLNCTDTILSEKDTSFCIGKHNDSYFITEKTDYSNETTYNGQYQSSFKKTFQEVKEIKNIPQDLFKQKIKIQNQNGLLILEDEIGNIYTTRVGYVQENKHYLTLRNNTIKSFELEKIPKLKKIVSNHRIYGLDFNHNFYIKEDKQWNKIDIDNVYDFIAVNENLLYLLTDKGIYKNIKHNTFGLKQTNGFELMQVDIGINDPEESNKIMKNIYNQNTLFQLDENKFNDDIKIELKNEILDDTRYHISIENKILIKSYRSWSKFSAHYPNQTHDRRLNGYTIDSAEQYVNISNNKKEYIALQDNKFTDKYGNEIQLNKKESIIISEYPQDHVMLSETVPFINIIKHDDKVFGLRKNGRLSIINVDTFEYKYLYNINKIEIDDNKLYMLVDKKFESEYSKMGKSFPNVIDTRSWGHRNRLDIMFENYSFWLLYNDSLDIEIIKDFCSPTSYP